MDDEAWESVAVMEDTKGEPHVLQQKVKVHTSGIDDDPPGYTSPLMETPYRPGQGPRGAVTDTLSPDAEVSPRHL